MAKNDKKRYDSKHRVLKTGEVERGDGFYTYRWTDRYGNRHSVTADSLDKLRKKEDEVQKSKLDGICAEAANVTVNDIYELWCTTKRGLKDNTFQNYKYMYNMFVLPDLGKLRVQKLKRSDVRLFYNKLVGERGIKINTVDCVHTVLHQVLEMAVEDGYMRTNVSDNVLKELKRAHNFNEPHRKALTIPEQNLFINYMENTAQYKH